MNDIICPHCEKAFKVDETGYAAILEQVRGKEFDREIHEHLKRAEKEKDARFHLQPRKPKLLLKSLNIQKRRKSKNLSFNCVRKKTSIDATVMRAVNEVEKQRDKLQAKLEVADLEKKQFCKCLKG